MVLGCQNNDLNELYLYFSTGKDLSSYVWENYNFFDLWNAVENGATPPERNPCNSSYIASVRSCTLAVLGNFTTINDFVGFNRDFYNLYLLIIGQEPVITPSFDSDCVASLYSVFSIGLTGKWRQPQDLTAVLSKSAALAFVQYQQTQSFNALISKSAALDQVVFQQQQTFNAELAGSFVGLLDDYPNAAAAYSIRLLSSSYSGALVRIRRSSDNQEKDFLPDTNNELSLNSSALVGGQSLGNFVGANDGFVVTWYDQSGNTNNATQSSASSQPQIINAGSLITENEKSALDGDGVNGWLSIPATPLNNVNQFSIFHTQRLSNIDGFISYFNQFDSFTAFNLLQRVNNQQVTIAIYGNSTSTEYTNSTANDGLQNLFSSFYNGTQAGGSQVTLYINSANIALTNNNTNNVSTLNNNPSQTNIGSRNGSNIITGTMQEIVIYTTDESANKTGIETNINDFYSIY